MPLNNNQPIELDFVPNGFIPLETNNEASLNQEPIELDFVPDGFQPLNESPQATESVPQELSTMDRLLQFGKGVGTTYGAIADIGNKYINAPLANLEGKIVETAGKGASYISPSAGDYLQEKAQDIYKDAENLNKSNTVGYVKERVNEIAGKDITPTDKLGRFLQGAGELGAPFPFGLSAVAKAGSVAKGAKALVGNVGRQVTLGAGGSAAVEESRDTKLFKDIPIFDQLEDFATAIFGMVLTDKGLSIAKKKILGDVSKSLNQVEGAAQKASQAKADLKDVGITNKVVGKLISTGSAPEKEVIAAAKKEGINLPFNVALNGSAQNFIANNFLQSVFVSRAYKDVIKNADKDMIDAVLNKINQISPENIGKTGSSAQAKEFLTQEKALIKDESDQLYKIADSYAKPTDVVSVSPVVEAIQNIKPLVAKADLPSKDMKFVNEKIIGLAEKWNLLPESALKDIKINGVEVSNLTETPELMNALIDALGKKAADIPLDKVIAQRAAFLKDINYEKDIPGIKNLMNHLIGGLDKAIESSINKEFTTHWRAANDYFKNNVANRIRTDMASSLMNGQLPKEAFDYMSSPQHIKELERILGNSDKAKEVMNALKRAKLQQVVVDTVLDASGSIKYGALSNLFNGKSVSQELFRELLGEEGYKGMKRLANIARAYSKSGKEFGNPSKTSFSLRDLTSIEQVGTQAAQMLFSLASPVGIGYLSAGTTGALAAPAVIKGISRIFANPKIINTATEYGLAMQKSEFKKARTLAARIGKLIEAHGKYPQASWELYRDNFVNEEETKKENN